MISKYVKLASRRIEWNILSTIYLYRPLNENTQLRQYGNAKLQTYCGELAEQQRPLYHVVLLELKGGIVPFVKAIPSEEQMNTWNWTADRKSHLVLNDIYPAYNWLVTSMIIINRQKQETHQWARCVDRTRTRSSVHVCQFLFSFLGKQEVLMIFFPLLKKNAEILNVISTAEFLKTLEEKQQFVIFSNPFESMYTNSPFLQTFLPFVALRCVSALLCVIQICFLLGPHMAASSHKMQMVCFFSSSTHHFRDCAVRLSYVTDLYRQNGRRLPCLFGINKRHQAVESPSYVHRSSAN